ncbi:MAG: hypothetical protein QG636_432, partial [Patescibacteria group bacterium]|nr:hypothetical protein [Patescibacteria group bacterium]
VFVKMLVSRANSARVFASSMTSPFIDARKRSNSLVSVTMLKYSVPATQSLLISGT